MTDVFQGRGGTNPTTNSQGVTLGEIATANGSQGTSLTSGTTISQQNGDQGTANNSQARINRETGTIRFMHC